MTKKTLNCKLFCALFLAMSITACENSKSSNPETAPVSSEQGNSSIAHSSSSSLNNGSSSEGVSSAAPFVYKTDTVKVNYNRPVTHSAAFLHFATGTLTHVPFDAWDIAISTANGEIIANNGIYGTGVRLLKTESRDLTEDLSALATRVIGIVDTNSNPFAGELTQGAGSGTVYIVRDAAGENFKITFTSFGPMGRYSLSVVNGLAGTEVQTISGSINAEYAFTYLNLSERSDVTTLFPKKSQWDVSFLRALEFQMGAPGTFGARSAIFFNAAQGVEAVVLDGQAIADVQDLSSASFTDNPLAIGARWYTFDQVTRIFSINVVTLGFRTIEGNYAKMQVRTFYGPDQEQFWSLVRYGYQPNGSPSFPE